MLEKIEKHNKVRIWTSTITTEDYLNMLYVLHLLKTQDKKIEISIVDSTKVPIDDEYPNCAAWNMVCVGDEGVKRLLGYEEKLASKKIDEFLNIWDELVKQNSSLRICVDSKVQSVNETYFD